MAQQVRENVFLDRMISTLSAGFAVLATVLAAIGLYGVLAYTVTQRTREFGLRMALGADGATVRTMVLGHVAKMTAVGGRHRVGGRRRHRPAGAGPPLRTAGLRSDRARRQRGAAHAGCGRGRVDPGAAGLADPADGRPATGLSTPRRYGAGCVAAEEWRTMGRPSSGSCDPAPRSSRSACCSCARARAVSPIRCCGCGCCRWSSASPCMPPARCWRRSWLAWQSAASWQNASPRGAIRCGSSPLSRLASPCRRWLRRRCWAPPRACTGRSRRWPATRSGS